MKQTVIIYKVIRYVSKNKKHVVVESNFGIIKKEASQVPSIMMAAFLIRERE